MKCPTCGSENVTITSEQVRGTARVRRTGCLWTLGRWMLILCTCGLWLLVGKRKETSHMEYTYQTVGICQVCGNRWNIAHK